MRVQLYTSAVHTACLVNRTRRRAGVRGAVDQGVAGRGLHRCTRASMVHQGPTGGQDWVDTLAAACAAAAEVLVLWWVDAAELGPRGKQQDVQLH